MRQTMILGATHLTPRTALTLFSLRPWIVAVAAQAIERQNAVDQHLYRLEASRDPLSATLVVFNLVAILLTTLMAVVTVGRAILNNELGFANVIWLSATMLFLPRPAQRDARCADHRHRAGLHRLPPCICIIAGMLVWTGLHLPWRESHHLRRRSFEDDASAAAKTAQELESHHV